jgi:hypothetical protein
MKIETLGKTTEAHGMRVESGSENGTGKLHFKNMHERQRRLELSPLALRTPVPHEHSQ